jgi:two-component system NtrC family sensor kinase
VFSALFFGFLAARQFTNPILQLIEGAGTIGQGNFDHRLQIETSDEIEDLAVQFNQMAAAIREREVENVRLRLQIQQHADRLEEMVEKRTKELREAQAQLVQAEMLGAIGRLAAGVAHEINNPMAVISTCVEGLHARLNGCELPDRLADLPEYLTAIREAAYRCKGITQKLLSFSRQSPLASIPTDVNQMLRETVALVDYGATQAAKRIRFNLDSDLPIIAADPDQLAQVFLNLTLNALDAMSAGDWLEICTHFTPGSANIEIRFQDTGCGISADQIGKVFEPFFTTKGAGRGTGLGLAICQGIIQSHQGSISIESVVGKGSTFVILIPVGETDGRTKEADNPTADRGR